MTYFDINTSMKDVELRYPFSKMTLQAKFHVGGCAACGFEPHETIAEVAKNHGKNALDMVQCLNQGLEDMKSAEISPREVDFLMQSVPDLVLVDVREPWEHEIVKLGKNSFLLNEENMPEVFKAASAATQVIVYCHHGIRSLNATLYMRDMGIKHARSLRGGIDLFSREINPELARY